MTSQPAELFSDIMELGIADGLKELLIEYGFTCQKILRIQSSQLALDSWSRRLHWKDYLQCPQRLNPKSGYHPSSSKNGNPPYDPCTIL